MSRCLEWTICHSVLITIVVTYQLSDDTSIISLLYTNILMRMICLEAFRLKCLNTTRTIFAFTSTLSTLYSKIVDAISPRISILHVYFYIILSI